MQQISKNSAAWKLKQFDPNFPICGPLPLPSVTRWLTLRPLDTKPEASTLNFSTIQPALHVATRRPVLEKNSDVVNIHNHIHTCTEVLNVVPPVRPYLDIPSSIPRFHPTTIHKLPSKQFKGQAGGNVWKAKRLTTSWLGFQFIQSTTRYPADFKIFASKGSPAAPVTTTCREYTTTTAITTTTRLYQKLPLLRKQKNQKNKGRSNQDDMSHQNNFYSIWSSTTSSQVSSRIELPARPVVLPKKPPKIQSFSCWNIKPCEDGAPRELLVPDCHLTKSSTCSCVQ